MNLFLKLFLVFLFLSNSIPSYSTTCVDSKQSASEILKTSDWNFIEKLLEDADKETLVLFDVDQTLITPNDPILKPKWEKYLDQLLGGKKVAVNEHGEKRYIFREILMKAPHSVINNKSIDFIEKKQREEIPVIAFTAAPGGKIGKVESFIDWRVDELQKFGFQFGIGNKLSDIGTLKLAKDPSLEFPPIYKSGVLITSLHDKGPVLMSFFKEINWIPKKVIFIDDKMHNLKSVAQSLEGRTKVLGIHYTGANDLPCDLDENIAKKQVSHFLETGKWVSQSKAEVVIP